MLAVLLAGGERRDEELDVEKVVGADGAEHVLDHPLGAGAQQVAEFGRIRIYGYMYKYVISLNISWNSSIITLISAVFQKACMLFSTRTGTY